MEILRQTDAQLCRILSDGLARIEASHQIDPLLLKREALALESIKHGDLGVGREIPGIGVVNVFKVFLAWPQLVCLGKLGTVQEAFIHPQTDTFFILTEDGRPCLSTPLAYLREI